MDATLDELIKHYATLVVEYTSIGWHSDAERARDKLSELEKQARVAVSVAAEAKVKQFSDKHPTWWDWAQLQYSISEDRNHIFTVVSLCKNWVEEVSWEFYSLPEAQLKIIQLIDWKDKDRDRGRGNRTKDLNKRSNTQ